MASIPDVHRLKSVLFDALARAKGRVRFEVAYFRILNGCLQPTTLRISTISRREAGGGPQSRFAALLESLRNPAPLELELAEELACVADGVRVELDALEGADPSMALRDNFEISSSFGLKGRILGTIVRAMRCARSLELGTGYGMSAMFILEAMAQQDAASSLVTVESSKTSHGFASRWLTERYRDRVTCALGSTAAVIPRLAETLAPIDFMFHDAGHSGADYVADFTAASPILSPGAVVLFDDIRWNDPRFASGDPRCHQGWLEVANHARVEWAVEIDARMGLVLVR